MATHSSILAWEIPQTEPGGLQSMGSLKVRSNLATEHALETIQRKNSVHEQGLRNLSFYNWPRYIIKIKKTLLCHSPHISKNTTILQRKVYS